MRMWMRIREDEIDRQRERGKGRGGEFIILRCGGGVVYVPPNTDKTQEHRNTGKYTMVGRCR